MQPPRERRSPPPPMGIPQPGAPSRKRPVTVPTESSPECRAWKRPNTGQLSSETSHGHAASSPSDHSVSGSSGALSRASRPLNVNEHAVFPPPLQPIEPRWPLELYTGVGRTTPPYSTTASQGSRNGYVAPPNSAVPLTPSSSSQSLELERQRDVTLRPFGDRDPQLRPLPLTAVCLYWDCLNDECFYQQMSVQSPLGSLHKSVQGSAASMVKCPFPKCMNECCIADRAVSGSPSARFGTSVRLEGTPEDYPEWYWKVHWEPQMKARRVDGKMFAAPVEVRG